MPLRHLTGDIWTGIALELDLDMPLDMLYGHGPMPLLYKKTNFDSCRVR